MYIIYDPYSIEDCWWSTYIDHVYSHSVVKNGQ